MLAREFPSEPWESLPPATRRQFLKVMGASLALAGLAGCRWPREEIVPFARPAGYTPGVPLQYATAMELGGAASGLLVTSYDGRPIKIEGNPSHPTNLGAADAITQASVLDLYDPARSRAVIRRQGGQRLAPGWADFAGFASEQFGALRSRGGQGLHILSEASSSSSLDALRERLQTVYPRATWHEYEPLSWDNEREGTALAFGRPMRAHLALEKADVIVCLDADPARRSPGGGPACTGFRRGPSQGRFRLDEPSLRGRERLLRHGHDGRPSLPGAVAAGRDARGGRWRLAVLPRRGRARAVRGIFLPRRASSRRSHRICWPTGAVASSSRGRASRRKSMPSST